MLEMRKKLKKMGINFVDSDIEGVKAIKITDDWWNGFTIAKLNKKNQFVVEDDYIGASYISRRQLKKLIDENYQKQQNE